VPLASGGCAPAIDVTRGCPEPDSQRSAFT
jgi:hypothetical protein